MVASEIGDDACSASMAEPARYCCCCCEWRRRRRVNESEQGGQEDVTSSGGHQAVAPGWPQHVAATRRQRPTAGQHCSRSEFFDSVTKGAD